jgi:hypothetical protein
LLNVSREVCSIGLSEVCSIRLSSVCNVGKVTAPVHAVVYVNEYEATSYQMKETKPHRQKAVTWAFESNHFN